MRQLTGIILVVIGMSGCATRPQPQTATSAAESDHYYVDRSSTAPVASRKLLPDPINGLGTTNDPSIRVTDIELTEKYTILRMTFKIDRTRDWNVTGSQISIQPQNPAHGNQ